MSAKLHARVGRGEPARARVCAHHLAPSCSQPSSSLRSRRGLDSLTIVELVMGVTKQVRVGFVRWLNKRWPSGPWGCGRTDMCLLCPRARGRQQDAAAPAPASRIAAAHLRTKRTQTDTVLFVCTETGGRVSFVWFGDRI